jgi:diguanylate cyclase (GGDEF)-like protein
LLEVAQAALRPHAVALFLLSPDGKSLQLKQALCEDPSALERGPIPAGEGMLGAVLKSGHAVARDHMRDAASLTYYSRRPNIRTFIGVPVMEGEHRRGVLLADRKAEIPFGEEDEALMLALAREIWRAFAVESVLERSDEEQQKLRLFYESSRQINRAVNQNEVLDQVLGAVRRIFASVDFAALVLRDPPEGRQLVIRAASVPESLNAWRERALMQAIEGDDHLCALAIKNGFAVPTVPFHKAARSQRSILGRRWTPEGLESLKVFPLKVAATREGRSVPGEVQTLGTLVVGSTVRGVFPEAGSGSDSTFVQDTLETLADIAAMAIQSAQRFEQLLRLATTDGLTGLHNHRRFQELLDGAVAEALRYQNPLSLILCDVDHFKKVNDTYGHPTGDEVLRRVARVLSELARQSDRVCRYGGEEFAVIMPHTDAEGAHTLAERFRQEIREQTFDGGGQAFQVSISLGICTLPAFARHKQELIDRSDEALYHAKHTGRDRVVHYASLPKDAGSPG